MALKEELKEQEKNCVDVKDYVELAKKALEEPVDIEYAKELLETAEDECKFPDEYVMVAEIYAQMNEKDKAEELYDSAEDNAFEPLELARLAHSIFCHLKNVDKSKELFQNALKDAKKVQEFFELLSYIQMDFPESDLHKTITEKISSTIRSVDELTKVAKEIAEKDKNLAIQIVKDYEKKVDGVINIANLSNLVYELFNDKDWAVELLEEAKDEAKFTNEFITLAKAFDKLGLKENVNELLEEARNYAVSAEENYDLAIAVWDILKDKTLTTTLLQKSYKSLKDKKAITNILTFSYQQLEDKEFSKEILDFLVENSTSNDELLQNIKLGFEILKDKEISSKHFETALSKLTEPKDLIKFGTELFNLIGDEEQTKIFFKKVFDNSVNFEQFLELTQKYFNLFGKDEFVSQSLEKCEEIAKSSVENIGIAKLYMNLMNDREKAKKNLEVADEIVASLQDMKLVAETVKELFPDDEEWIKQVEEKLAKRQANQSKYDEFLKLEKDAKYLKDYLTLAERVITELDDVYYAKKLLNKANELLDNQYLNIENYYKLSKAIIQLTKDTNWAKSIFDSLFKRIRFIQELEDILKFVHKLFDDKEKTKAITETYLNGWQRKTTNLFDALKFSKVLQKYKFETSEIENFLKNFVVNEKSFSSLFPALKLAYDLNLDNLKKEILNEIWKLDLTSNEFVVLLKFLVGKGYDKDELLTKFNEFCNRTNKPEDLILLAENYSNIFGVENIEQTIRSILEKAKDYEDILYKIKSIVVEQKYW
ncbi:hypothetical protein D9V84_06345 [Bacteroidetes/Chlorobi group bacterium Naka2016]|jgi:tetratricopeptide (TPR) repeat protein|nr:MAG: hypothetical protein D9V84_06345 [Bacteroidetes/Chlorobi group bacterium Naka2016]